MTTHNDPRADEGTTRLDQSDALSREADPSARTPDPDLDADDRRADTDPSDDRDLVDDRDRRADTELGDDRDRRADPDPGRDTGDLADADLSADDTRRTDEDSGDGERRTGTSEEPLVAADAVVDFRARWEVIQQGFVDDPRNSVTEADKLVDDLLKRLSATFEEQHRGLESQWSNGEPSTEDLRGALQKYRAFFQRLLTL